MSHICRFRDFVPLLAFVWSGLFAQIATAASGADPVTQIDTKILNTTATNIVLQVALKNVGSKDLLIPEGYLPWDRYAMTLVVVGTDPASTPLDQRLEIADPIPGKPWRIRKGETLAGKIDLTDRFPDLAKLSRQAEVIVFWSYQVETEGKTKSERRAGWSLIPRKGS
jgi:hypothetical protein